MSSKAKGKAKCPACSVPLTTDKRGDFTYVSMCRGPDGVPESAWGMGCSTNTFAFGETAAEAETSALETANAFLDSF